MVPHTVTAEEEIDEETDGENILTVDLPTSNGFFPNVAFSQIFNPIVQNKKTPSAKILSSCCQSILKSQLIVWNQEGSDEVSWNGGLLPKILCQFCNHRSSSNPAHQS
ncbi:hypothetical protein Pmani_024871 [Petrolisthes manimaculis]|uniref:Uncharacterized protein n=1 Tax=Petrolisthes manimaculis TaxID=1843537 RepID=A0AAE1P7B6_9EUCA|nr:hypothetical protein Pmani_024871 [Petrolisthes manimaculis]